MQKKLVNINDMGYEKLKSSYSELVRFLKRNIRLLSRVA